MFTKIKKITIFIMLICVFLVKTLYAHPKKYIINKKHSEINCSVKYALIGKYRPTFQSFSGEIIFDEDNLANSSVSIEVETISIKSNYPVLDRLAKSSRLLDVNRYPIMRFYGDKVRKVGKGYEVEGVMEIHGGKNKCKYLFEVVSKNPGSSLKDAIVAKGSWKIFRKAYGVVWHDRWDKAGLVVGNHIIVDWKVLAENEKGGRP